VTIVAKKVTPSGDKFELSQFQVVNGCQTSNVLFNNRERLTDDMYITVKLIETSDVDLSGKLIATTNSQSQVTKEAFATIRPYHRELEDFFNAMRSTGYGYFYERRPHQYDDKDDIQQYLIVSAPALIKSFVSVVVEEPHKVHYYYGRLLIEYNKNRSSELFAETDYPGLYFAAHHITAKTRNIASRDRYLSQWGFHIALLIKKQLAPELKKGTALTDKKFLEMMKRIDDGFRSAYSSASKIVWDYNFHTNQNRFHEATSDLVNEQARRTPKATTRTPSPLVTPLPDLTLTDGNYVGQIEEIDVAARRIRVKYGPYVIEGLPASNDALAQIAGSRVPFSIKNNVATISLPQYN